MILFHQQALVFYNSLLLGFQERGFASGLGVAFGYLGSAFALLFLAKSLKEPEVYAVVGMLFFLLFLPSLKFLENPSPKAKLPFKEILKDKRFILFILSLLCLTEVANTLIAMMGVYLREVFHFERETIYRVIGLSAFGGILGGVFWGKVTDAFGVRRVFPFGFLLWSVFLILLFFSSEDFIYPVGLLAGFSLAHLWTTSRVYITNEFPQESVALRMSFLSLSERIASSVGLSFFSLMLFLTEGNYELSALSMIVFPLLGVVLYYRALRNRHELN